VLAGSADMLSRHSRELTEEDRAELFAAMGASATRLRRLLEDLLTASRLERSVLEMNPEQIQVDDLVSDAIVRTRRTHPAVEIVVDVASGLSVYADPDRLAQALDNLIGNAARHGLPQVRIIGRAAGHDTTEIRVTDAGTGVSEVMRSRLFDRFATGRTKGGTGLGLFIVRELARAQAGDATYEPPSTTDPAGAFVITLPSAPGEPG